MHCRNSRQRRSAFELKEKDDEGVNNKTVTQGRGALRRHAGAFEKYAGTMVYIAEVRRLGSIKMVGIAVVTRNRLYMAKKERVVECTIERMAI
jgi:hypothetical protein